LRESSLYTYELHTSVSRSSIGRQQDPIHVLYASMSYTFCRSTSEVGVFEQSRYSASTERVLVYTRSVFI